MEGVIRGVTKSPDDDRTSDVGLYHYANSYRRAADALGTIKSDATHPDAPRSFLYYHAIELYLKAFLRNQGASVEELRRVGHNCKKLSRSFDKLGGFLADEDRCVLELMTETDSVMRARYIKTGPFTQPALEALARTSISLHETVREALKKSGASVR